MRMQQYQHRSLQQQKGVAAVWMGLLLVPIMGVTFGLLRAPVMCRSRAD